MSLHQLMLSIPILFGALTSISNSQIIQQGPYGPVVQPSFQPSYAQPSYTQPSYPQPYQNSTPPIWNSTPKLSNYPVPSRPLHVTPNQFNGYNSHSGGINTTNTQINNTAYAYGREQSRYNGSARYVDRPVYGQNGTVIGYERGTEWNNGGIVHGDTKVFTPNSQGGVHEQKKLRSRNVQPVNPSR